MRTNLGGDDLAAAGALVHWDAALLKAHPNLKCAPEEPKPPLSCSVKGEIQLSAVGGAVLVQ